MKKTGFVFLMLEAIKDPERDFEERLYLALSAMSLICVFVALIMDIVYGESIKEIVTIALIIIFVFLLTYVTLKLDKIKIAIKVTVIGLIVAVVPSLFFFGGGVEGGGVLWIIFTFIYAGLVLSGRWRATTLIIIVLEALVFYLLNYFFPELVNEHSKSVFFADSFVSLVLVGLICFAMTWLQSLFLTDENRRAKEAAKVAEELTRSQNRFFSSMSHEIRTPINSILGLNELILRDQAASDEILKDASGIQGSGKMLLSLINDILDFSKMEAGGMTIVPVDYKVGDLLSEIVNMIWIRASEKGLKLNVSVDPKVPSVLYGDEVRIRQIIVNLLNNAVKYTNEGSVDLSVESEQKDDKTVLLSISVADTGMGIKKEVLPYIFDAFRRVEEDRNRMIEGTGLGLSIVKQLVVLMGGTITVNSVYGEGSTFTVELTQGISNAEMVGDLNIHNEGVIQRRAYESSFRAPEARILIVDDNEMNLEVESKLLTDTEIEIDKALSGKDALELTLKRQYDVILMDHLMPEMDGIKCFEELRRQAGSMNHTTPVVVLTANAGSENKELYNRAGFDGYLVKPVSGEALENVLMKYISSDKLIINTNRVMSMKTDIDAAFGYSGKAPVIITSTSMCDLPDSIIKRLHLSILPFLIRTEEGVFKDGVQMGEDEVIRYLNTGKNALSSPPDEAAYTEFFASALKKAHHVIHIAITSSMSNDYKVAMEAAKSFDNVTVINSEAISSATGILVLIAYKLTQMTDSVEEIVEELEMVKQRLKCSFIIDNTEYMARRGLIRKGMDSFARSLSMHPCVQVKNDRSMSGGVWIGSTQRAYRKYIDKVFPVDVIPDPELVFVTYADVPMETLMWIKEEISRHAYFENVIFEPASAAITSNCGPGSFGILYFVKSNKSYNLASLIVDESEVADEPGSIQEEAAQDKHVADDHVPGENTRNKTKTVEDHWYDTLRGIDGKAGITNSGSEDAYRTILKVFYDSVDSKVKEIEDFYSSEDWKDYTIKVHALKSSFKIIGAMETAERAQLLEDAGKAENIAFIKENHSAFMEEVKGYKQVLFPVFGKEITDETQDSSKPVADDFLIESVYEGLLDAATEMDCDALEAIFEEVEGYAIPDREKEKFETLRKMAAEFDYSAIVGLLKQDQKL